MSLIISLLSALCILFYLAFFWHKTHTLDRLYSLANDQNQNTKAFAPINWSETDAALQKLRDRLGRSGLLTKRERLLGIAKLAAIFFSFLFLGCFLGAQKASIASVLVGTIIGCYTGILAALFYLDHLKKEFHREVIFQIPILLEGIILLVEAGFGILPALEHATSTQGEKTNPLKRLFYIVYQLTAHGLPFSQALETVADAVDIKVLRHVLMHLDISNSEGGELIPSLRSLSEHAHSEWKISVETRVKRLENFVVFPVFVSVIGLLMLVAAVPLVPVMNLKDSLKAHSQTSASSSPTAYNQRATSNR